MVTITGKLLPEQPDVYFGESQAEIVTVVAPNFIIVDTPPGELGWVNVRVVDSATDDEAVMDNAFLYTEGNVEPPPTTTTTTTFSPTPTTQPITTTSFTPGPTTTTPVVTTLPPTPTTQPWINPMEEFDKWRDSLLRTPEGLNLAPPAPDDPMSRVPLDAWIGALCDEPICPGWVLED